LTKETKYKISKSLKGRKPNTLSEEAKLRISKHFKGKTLSEETKQKYIEGWELRRLRLNKPRSKYLIKKYGT
jgi:hypothetical protein